MGYLEKNYNEWELFKSDQVKPGTAWSPKVALPRSP